MGGVSHRGVAVMSENHVKDDDQAAWTPHQKLVLALCALTIVLDGFDTQVIGFAAPALLADWGIQKSDMAPVLALGLIGMTIGAAAGGWLGDKIGRKFAIIGSVLIFGALTAATATATNLTELAIMRLIAGLGLGGALPNTAALVGEFTPAKWRSLAVSITVVCIPVGGVVGGLFAAPILPSIGWEGLFLVAGGLPLLIAIVLYFYLPESPQFLAARETQSETGLQASEPGAAKTSSRTNMFREAFKQPHLLRDTIALWIAFFVCLLSNYLYFNWLPVMLSEAGFNISEASLGLLCYNLGGVVSGVGVAALIRRYGSKAPMTILGAVGVITASFLIVMPLDSLGSLQWLMGFMFLQGACIAGFQVLLYVVAVHVFPVEIRATGIGSAAGIGRIGGVVASALGAIILAAMGSPGFFTTIAVSMTIASLCLIAVRRQVKRV